MYSRLFLYLTIQFFVLCNAFSQVTGNAFLPGMTNHEGIKVKFLASSPTAATDSTFTITSGLYSIDLKGGVYQVVFSKSGYPTFYYNKNQPLAIATNTRLEDVYLLPSNYVSVKGNVSGLWDKDTTYIVASDLMIPSGKSLVIEPGTHIKFNGNYQMVVDGELKAIGTEKDSISFTSFKNVPAAGDWQGIVVKDQALPSKIQYCNINYATKGIRLINDFSIVSQSKISKFLIIGIDISYANALITQNTICDFNNLSTINGESAVGILAIGNSTIDCNQVFNGYGCGIRIIDNNIVTNNTIHHIIKSENEVSSDLYSSAIHTYSGKSLIKNNIIYSSNVGIYGYSGPSMNYYSSTIVQNTIFSNNIGILTPHIELLSNNIISKNKIGISKYFFPDSTTYNLFWDNDNDYENTNSTFLGKIIGNNNNGDPIDSYYNVYADPEFTDAPQIAQGSAAIGAGTEKSTIGIDVKSFCNKHTVLSTYTSRGAINDIIVFPNPSNGVFNISGSDIGVNFTVEVMDAVGKPIVSNDEKLGNNLVVNLGTLPAGIYYLKVSYENGQTVTKPIFKE